MNTASTNWKQNFFTIWTGQAFSQFSSSVLQFAIVWYLTDQTGSAMVLTIAMMMGFLPQGVLGPFIGVFIDRYSRKRIMIISDLLISAASFAMVAAGWMGALTTELILVVLLLRSVGAAFHTPCLQAVTPQIVPPDQLTRCSGYSQALESVSQILSPAVAAVLYSSWSLSGIVFLDVIGALIAVFTLGIAVIPELQRDENSGSVRVLREAMEGFRILQTNKGMLGLVLIGSLYTLALMPTSALFQRHQHKRQHRGGGILRWPAVRFPGAVQVGRDEKQGLHHCGLVPSHEPQLIDLRHAAARRLLAVRRLFLAHGRVRPLLLGNVHAAAAEQLRGPVSGPGIVPVLQHPAAQRAAGTGGLRRVCGAVWG